MPARAGRATIAEPGEDEERVLDRRDARDERGRGLRREPDRLEERDRLEHAGRRDRDP